MERKIEKAKLFNFRDDLTKDPSDPEVRKRYNQIFQDHGLEITVVGLDVLSSLINLVGTEQTLNKIFDDMITLTLSQEYQTEQPDDPGSLEYARRRLMLQNHLEWLERKQYIDRKSIETGEEDLEIYSITEQGIRVMTEAKQLLRP